MEIIKVLIIKLEVFIINYWKKKKQKKNWHYLYFFCGKNNGSIFQSFPTRVRHLNVLYMIFLIRRSVQKSHTTNQLGQQRFVYYNFVVFLIWVGHETNEENVLCLICRLIATIGSKSCGLQFPAYDFFFFLLLKVRHNGESKVKWFRENKKTLRIKSIYFNINNYCLSSNRKFNKRS